MPSVINVVLDAQNEATPEFDMHYIYGPEPSQGSLHLPVFGARTTNTNNVVNLALELVMLDADGDKVQMHNGTSLVDAWRTVDADYVAIAANEHSEYSGSWNMIPGAVYRVRYASAQTDPIRVVVPTPYADLYS